MYVGRYLEYVDDDVAETVVKALETLAGLPTDRLKSILNEYENRDEDECNATPEQLKHIETLDNMPGGIDELYERNWLFWGVVHQNGMTIIDRSGETITD
ncbi:hypothetical protein [Caballeronia zhejiangensis]|uniref:hypothetical protein n=1 Tax=Caballeronia zhejiangensis TaxID=871203 RepID=UPI001F52A902|nr:hypothetical protein [Caballeronia zhejiangensis]MCI1041775.1 hypothetical protein [Caballeronia zhejiangensis]